MKIILASQSPRRRQLMEWAEIDFEVVVIPTDESYPSNLKASEVAMHIARQKMLVVKEKFPSRIIVAADTIVVVDEEIIGKPAGRDEAIASLKKINGRKHEVITGVAMCDGNSENIFFDITEVEFHQLTESEIEFYVDKYQPYDKAGAYAIQEWIGVVGIKSVRGDFYNVMGLPVSLVTRILKEYQR